MIAPKLCIDCKYFNQGTKGCRAPKNNRVNATSLVDGSARYVPVVADAEFHRSINYSNAWIFGLCGKRGRWFESK